MKSWATSLAAGAAILTIAGCSANTNTGLSGQTSATIHLVNAVHGTVNLLVDGVQVSQNTGLGGTLNIGVSAGAHSLAVVKVGGGTSAAQAATLSDGGGIIVVAMENSGTVGADILADTNAIVPAGATKLRVAHYAQNAPAIDIWRTQPDYATPIRVQFPFPYLAVSPYLQSTVGGWDLMVSHAAAGSNPPMPDTLANTGAIAVADGKSKTVIVTDGATAGTVQLVVVDP
ncbi:MAG TPA: DUF4397 domain-containing protein [Gemmatimonadales bacterium]